MTAIYELWMPLPFCILHRDRSAVCSRLRTDRLDRCSSASSSEPPTPMGPLSPRVRSQAHSVMLLKCIFSKNKQRVSQLTKISDSNFSRTERISVHVHFSNESQKSTIATACTILGIGLFVQAEHIFEFTPHALITALRSHIHVADLLNYTTNICKNFTVKFLATYST